jgi:Tfp pilus assembly protein PilF
MRYLEVLMRECKSAQARDGLRLALDSFQCNNSAKQWRLRERFAILEFKSGHTEHGRTLFDDLLQNKPKQFGFWCVYADMEAKYGEADHARQVYDRATTLKKWLDFETKNGNYPQRKSYIKQVAVEYRAQKQHT